MCLAQPKGSMDTDPRLEARLTVKVVKTQSLGRPLVFLNLSLMYRLRCSMLHTVPSFRSMYSGLFFCMNYKQKQSLEVTLRRDHSMEALS